MYNIITCAAEASESLHEMDFILEAFNLALASLWSDNNVFFWEEVNSALMPHAKKAMDKITDILNLIFNV